jgi:hypothetical protein
MAANTGQPRRSVNRKAPAALDITRAVSHAAPMLDHSLPRLAGFLLFVLTAPLWLVSSAFSAEATNVRPVRFDPVVRDLEGWKVHIEPVLIDGEHREEGAKALTMLANHLQRIKILVPAEPLKKMQTIEIWIEHSHPVLKPKQYHPSRQWLVANKHDPRLARKVHIPQARDLLSREQMLKHPAVILHELAHAYHDQILSFDHPEILAAYEKAKAAGNYESVLAHTGKKVKHYGLTTRQEYFAEGTEAFFYRNDFYPFVRAELKEHDPTLHDLLAKIWAGPLEAKASDNTGK